MAPKVWFDPHPFVWTRMHNLIYNEVQLAVLYSSIPSSHIPLPSHTLS